MSRTLPLESNFSSGMSELIRTAAAMKVLWTGRGQHDDRELGEEIRLDKHAHTAALLTWFTTK